MFIPEKDVCMQRFCLFTLLFFKLLQPGHQFCLHLVDLRPVGHLHSVTEQLNVNIRKMGKKGDQHT